MIAEVIMMVIGVATFPTHWCIQYAFQNRKVEAEAARRKQALANFAAQASNLGYLVRCDTAARVRVMSPEAPFTDVIIIDADYIDVDTFTGVLELKPYERKEKK